MSETLNAIDISDVIVAGEDDERRRLLRDAELGRAWSDAEAALPERYGLSLNAWNAEIVAMADLMSAATESELRSAPSFRGTGPTPAAALRELARRLRDGA